MGAAALGVGVSAGVGPITVRDATPLVHGSIGIMGGTFDPIHVGHLAAAEEAREALGLDRILFVPAGRPPHKPDRPITPAQHRLAMVELAIAGNDAFELSRIEVDRDGPSYTFETVELLAAAERTEDREPDLTLILSVESFHGFPTWHEPRRILALCRLAVVPRGGFPTPERAWLAEQFRGVPVRVAFLDAPRLRLSGSEIRQRVAAGRSIRYLVPDAVLDYIGDHGLYTNPISANEETPA
jgi:nicotinate-nucleotide adenylyltransferase